MEEIPENSKESSYSAHANGMNEGMITMQNVLQLYFSQFSKLLPPSVNYDW
jgi:hypothetical protein